MEAYFTRVREAARDSPLTQLGNIIEEKWAKYHDEYPDEEWVWERLTMRFQMYWGERTEQTRASAQLAYDPDISDHNMVYTPGRVVLDYDNLPEGWEDEWESASIEEEEEEEEKKNNIVRVKI